MGCQPVATAPKPARGGTAVEALVGAPGALNPLFEVDATTRDVDSVIYQGLTTVDAQQNVIGLLASTWTISPNHLSYTFVIRKGIRWADGQPFTALNGGPHFKFNEAISLQIECETQAEVDYYWEKLGAGGPVEAQQCGWLKDKFGLSWQVVPQVLPQMLTDADSAKRERAMSALMGMKKFDVEALQRAFTGNA